MKTTYNYLKMLSLVLLLAASHAGKAQSPCTATLNYSTGPAGSASFTLVPGAMPNGNINWTFSTPQGTAGFNATTQTHTFPSNGPYVVTATYSITSSPSCFSSTSQTVMITNAGCNLNANFTAASSMSANVTYFSNTTTGANGSVTYLWSYGDGTSGTSNMHTYPASGTYVATLTANNNTSPACISTATLLVNVPYGPACAANAGFTMTPSGTPQVWNAAPSAPSNIASATWSWGDGSTSNTLYTSHTYSAAGTYSICLMVTAHCGDGDTSCFSYAIYRTANPNQDMNVITVQVIDPLTVGVKKTATANRDVSIAPNPGNGFFELRMSSLKATEAAISVYDVAGRQVYAATAETANGSLAKEIDLKEVPGGVYFIQVNSGADRFTKKVIVQH